MFCIHFLQAYLRFTSLFRVPACIFSDNCSTFIQGLGIVSEGNTSNIFEEHLTRSNVAHIRIPVRSAWVGATWERQIRTIKSCLYKVTGRKKHEYFHLITILSEIQNCVNSRPLTYRDNKDASLEIITPNDFVKFDPGRTLHLDHVAGTDIPVPNRRDVVRAVERREEITEKFRELWYTEYLLSLRESSQNTLNPNWINRIRKDEIVLVSNPEKTKPFWQLGRVVELLPGKDDVVRFVRVLRGDGSRAVHPINHLYPMELEASVPLDEKVEDEIPPVERPKRRAALKALDNIKKYN